MADMVDSADRAALNSLVAEVVVGHFGFSVDGLPVVMPIAVASDGDTLLLHGSTGSWWLRQLATGIPVSMAITAVDGLVVARSAFESSMHYRSGVLFGRCVAVEGQEKVAALDVITEALIPGRTREVRASLPKELAATLVLRMIVDEFSVKVSHDWPEDTAADLATDVWAGVIPLVAVRSEPLPAPDLRAGIALPESVRRLAISS
ncbi:MAG: pyridoxamine 5'-phosphate oxidase family protein [Microbacteriaceae bacterium]|nr:pyridoxamine 5'-phosphate oxidase family protein [Microbacteriaceae bacterium]